MAEAHLRWQAKTRLGEPQGNQRRVFADITIKPIIEQRANAYNARYNEAVSQDEGSHTSGVQERNGRGQPSSS
jgi:hypothetical protein